MNLYKVHNNSPVIDFIVLYLFMRVSLITDGDAETLKLVKTKYRNIHQMFAKRYEDVSLLFNYNNMIWIFISDFVNLMDGRRFTHNIKC